MRRGCSCRRAISSHAGAAAGTRAPRRVRQRGAVARPAITVALGMAGAAAVPAAAASAGGLSVLVHHVGDVVVGTAATIAGEGALGLTMAGLKPLIERLFAGWSAERSHVLAETLHDVVLGDRLEEIDRLANAAAAPEVTRARQLLQDFGRELGPQVAAAEGREAAR